MVAEKALIFLMSMTKPVEGPLDVFLAFFFFLSYRQNCPNYFSNCTLRRKYSSPKGLAFYMLQIWLHLLYWKSVEFQTHASIPGVHPPIGNEWSSGSSTFTSAKKGKAGAGQWTGNRKLVMGRKSNPKGMWKWRWPLWAVSHFLGNGNIIWKPGILVLLINQILTDFRYYCFQISKSTGQGKPH